MPNTAGERRPLTSRDTRWARALASALVRRRVRPNAISVGSVVAAAVGCAAFACAPTMSEPGWRAGLYVLAAASIQLRLLCNLLDGMVAIEGGLGGRTGELFNELPDRFGDLLLIVGAGYAARELSHAVELGWLATALALITAYVRALGKSIGGGMHFLGPMAKPHRMATLTIAALVAAAIALIWAGEADPRARPSEARTLCVALAAIAIGCVLTIARRLRRIRDALEAA